MLARQSLAVKGFKTPYIGLNLLVVRSYATEPVKKKKKTPTADISQVPVKSISTIADIYVPPKLFDCPIKSWPRLIMRRMGVFGVNTYSVFKFRNDTKLKLKFNDWKDEAMEKFVRTNKIFAAGCNLPISKRKDYLSVQLEGNVGTLVSQALTERALTFPNNGKLTWELVDVVTNPKVISFTVLPDNNNVTTYLQIVLKVSTKQKVTFTDGKQKQETERVVSDNLVYSLNPFNDEIVLVGTLFESDHLRGIQPEISFQDTKVMQEFQKQAADIFRANPKSLTL